VHPGLALDLLCNFGATALGNTGPLAAEGVRAAAAALVAGALTQAKEGDNLLGHRLGADFGDLRNSGAC
jgi:hypothetical protein